MLSQVPDLMKLSLQPPESIDITPGGHTRQPIPLLCQPCRSDLPGTHSFPVAFVLASPGTRPSLVHLRKPVAL